MIGFIVGDGVTNKYLESEYLEFWKFMYNRYQAKIMKLSTKDLRSKEGINQITARDYCFKRMCRYKTN